MVFSSLLFIYLFLPICLLASCIPKTIRGKNAVLLAFSLFFYSWGEPVWILQLLLSGTLVWALSLRMHQAQGKREKKKILILTITVALLPLIIFKYSGFFIENINALFGLQIPLPGFRMPIGISFYTFQIITYAVDLYRGSCGVQRRLGDFLLYQSLFPQLIAGPIVCYRDIEREIYDRRVSPRDFVEGSQRFIIGLAKKTLLANPAGALVQQTLGSGRLEQLSGLAALLGLIAFTFQIYFDFSAYSDMAIGLGRLFGFHFQENFRYPYISRSATEFWRRWHISLGNFFRHYVYIPMGGNRRHPWRNLFVVWFLTGFWHGASWNFILWGLYYLLILLIEKNLTLPWLERLPRPLAVLLQTPVAIFGWSIFYFTNLSEWRLCWQRIFAGGGSFSTLESQLLFRQNLPFLILCLLCSLPWIPIIQTRISSRSRLRFEASPAYLLSHMLSMGFLLFMSTASLAGESFNPFLYFRF